MLVDKGLQDVTILKINTFCESKLLVPKSICHSFCHRLMSAVKCPSLITDVCWSTWSSGIRWWCHNVWVISNTIFITNLHLKKCHMMNWTTWNLLSYLEYWIEKKHLIALYRQFGVYNYKSSKVEYMSISRTVDCPKYQSKSKSESLILKVNKTKYFRLRRYDKVWLIFCSLSAL